EAPFLTTTNSSKTNEKRIGSIIKNKSKSTKQYPSRVVVTMTTLYCIEGSVQRAYPWLPLDAQLFMPYLFS
ncbi:MAG: hypothetical protein VX049_01685, partial [Pseudomonadota bacterium]|nr:hypothetical protein [Pseudomonadota bacterium]